jgi:AraC family L-rhamnose operon transcriptional activator RhaR/AraC family L-rhamnose operon regulatory protein RhaS
MSLIYPDRFVDRDFPFDFGQACLDGEDFPVHQHDCSELVIIRRGHGIHIADEEEYPLVAGDVYVIKEQHSHGFRQTVGLEMVNIMFLPSLFGSAHAFLRSSPGYHMLFALEPAFRRQHNFASHLQLHGAQLSVIDLVLSQMEHESKQQPPGYTAMLFGHFVQLAVLLSRRYAQTVTPSTHKLRQVSEIISLLETRSAQQMTLPELAAIANCSVNTLLRLFKQATGRTPMDYLLHLRLSEAARLLRASDMTITQIAYQVGFTDSSYFSRQFKKQTGWTPLDYRQRLQL